MSARPKRTAATVDEAGALEAMKGVASQALPADPIPSEHSSPEAWATYVNAARGRAAAAVIEWGRRIAAAQAVYQAQGQRWGRTWDDWCRDNLGIGERHANRLRMIGENLGLSKSEILPATTDQLHALARLRKQAPAAFEAAIASGTITPQMTRTEAISLLKAATTGKALPASAAASQAPFRRVAGLTLEAHQADKLEAIAAARGTTPAQLLAEVAGAWLHRQPMPEGVVTVDTVVSSAEDHQ